MTKHTPGPWVASSRNSSVVGWPIVGRNGRSICNLTMPPRAVSVTPAYEAESQANAKLIEAAPDMLAALMKLREPITFAGGHRDYSILDDYRELILPIIDAAIAKATATAA